MLLLNFWCGRQDLNLHTEWRKILNLAQSASVRLRLTYRGATHRRNSAMPAKNEEWRDIIKKASRKACLGAGDRT